MKVGLLKQCTPYNFSYILEKNCIYIDLVKNLTKLQAFRRLKGATSLHVEDENYMDLMYFFFLSDVMYTCLHQYVWCMYAYI